MQNHFLEGFVDELVKTAGPMATLKRGATMLGKTVKNVAGKVGKKMRKMKKKANEDLFGMGSGADEGDEGDEGYSDAEQAGEFLRQMMMQAQDRGRGEDAQAGADAPLFGGGRGLGFAAARPPSAKPASISTVAKPPERTFGAAVPRPRAAPSGRGRGRGMSMSTVAKPPERQVKKPSTPG